MGKEQNLKVELLDATCQHAQKIQMGNCKFEQII
jgi:hypothetical protein